MSLIGYGSASSSFNESQLNPFEPENCYELEDGRSEGWKPRKRRNKAGCY
jgi:hypothetical protein